MASQLEHLNLTVRDLDATLALLLAALPDWRVRGQGRMDWYGKSIRWLHVGSDTQYLALQSGGEGDGPAWDGHATGAKHAGFAVPSIDAVLRRLAAAGLPPDHVGGSDAHRRSIYFSLPGALQIEFVEYLSDVPALRNTYPINAAA